MHCPQTAGRPGLHYIPKLLSPSEQGLLVAAIDAHPWNGPLASRRTQHHGYIYDYRARTVLPEHHLGPLPDWLQALAERVHTVTELTTQVPVQAIVNEYGPGQGIGWHYDSVAFGPEVATISLLEDWHMEFHPRYQPKLLTGERDSLLETGSCLVMTGDSRYRWYHSIPRLQTEKHGRQRGRRLSVTLRTLRQD